MKIFSKLMLFAAAALSMGMTACSDDDPVIPDEISISPAQATVGSKGGEAKVTVTSSKDWTLSYQANDYVTVSAQEGKNGDVVIFSVKANDKHEDKTFNYDFVCGEEKASFALKLTRKADDELTLNFTEGANNFEAKGGEMSVNVVSSENWTLQGTSDFVTPSATEGQDGDSVKFTVAENTETVERSADFTFVCGEKKVAFQIKQAAFVETLEIVSNKEVRHSYKAEDKFAVTIKTTAESRAVSAEITSATKGWLTYTITRPGNDGNLISYFKMTENTTGAVRVADVTITTTKGATATMKVSQLPKSEMSMTDAAFFVGAEAQDDYAVALNTNVPELDVKIEGADWVTYKNFADGKLHFSVTALPAEVKNRTCTVTVTEKNPAENIAAVSVSFTLTQKGASLINCVADMRKSRAFFKTLSNRNALHDLKKSTIECLVYITDKRSNGSLSSIMGVEGKYLLRMGDSGLPWNQLQVVTTDSFDKITSEKMQLKELNKWYHIAVTFGIGDITVFINGEQVYKKGTYGNYPSFDITNEGNGDESTRAFWIGYSYSSDRYFPGYMSEVRVWNRMLSADEIKAENHFYTVDPNSEGLVGYWKFNEGTGNIIKDYSASGNDMVGQKNVSDHNGMHYGEEGMNWVKTMVP